MRAGGCTVQQALTPEAATVVKQAINLARRRGHAQVTPLHVANTMLSSSTGLLRAACLQSHSHPLQCRALELCFNVALNRLPASTLSAPMLGLPQADHHHHHHLHPPSLSNALVAAFKRAQAHQRRGSIETQQQQPLLAVKIELEQLVISILDDPSVSRVMREAGFSSTQVKSNVEQAVSVEICSSTPPSRTPPPPPTGKTRTLVQVKNEDVMSVTDALASRRKKSIVIVGECLATAEAVVGGVRDRVHNGEVPEVSRNLQFITLPLFSFRQMPAEEVDQKVGELRCFVKSCCEETGVVLYLKDMDWAAEYRASRGEKGRSYYCSLEHILMEIKNLAFGGIEGEHSNERIWLMAIATYQTYTRFCRTGSPSLETLLALQPLTIPVGGLGLSLNFDSGLSQIRSKISGVQFLPPAADEIGSPEVPSLHINSCGSLCSMSSGLPSWLRRCKEEGNRDQNSGDQGCRQLKELCRQWNSICSSTHKSDNHPSEITFNFSSVSPSSSSNVSSYDGHSRSLHQNQQPSLLPRKAKRPWSEHHFWISEEAVDEGPEQKPGNKARENAGQKLSTFPFLYLNSHPNSNSSGSTMETESSSKFKELNAENFKFLCNALERKVTWQQDNIPEIVSIILQCRSGLTRRKGKSKSSEKKEETWLLFQGSDTEGKERIGRELARLVFGSSTKFITVGHGNLSSTQSDSTDVLLQIKRSRAEASHSRLQSLFEAIRENPHRVIIMEDIEQVDHYTLAGIKRAMERGKLQSYGGEEVSLCDAIIILSCESFDSRSRACSPLIKQRAESEDEKELDTCVSLDLNLCAEDEDLDDHCFDSAGLLECVDRAFFFNLPDVL